MYIRILIEIRNILEKTMKHPFPILSLQELEHFVLAQQSVLALSGGTLEALTFLYGQLSTRKEELAQLVADSKGGWWFYFRFILLQRCRLLFPESDMFPFQSHILRFHIWVLIPNFQISDVNIPEISSSLPPTPPISSD